MAFTPHTVHNFELKFQSCTLCVHTNEENGVADEAIVIEWVVSSADFGVLVTFWCGTSTIVFGSLLGQGNTRR